MLNENYWTHRCEAEKIGWDVRGINTPLRTYFDQLSYENIKINLVKKDYIGEEVFPI